MGLGTSGSELVSGHEGRGEAKGVLPGDLSRILSRLLWTDESGESGEGGEEGRGEAGGEEESISEGGVSVPREVGPSWPLPVGLVCELTELCVGADPLECRVAEIGESTSSWALCE